MALAHGHHISQTAHDAGPSSVTLAPATAVEAAKNRASRRLRSHRSTKASDQGVWTASLFLGLVAGIMPAWFIGSATLLQRSETEVALAVPFGALLLLGIGALATIAAARCAILLTHAPRVKRGNEGGSLRVIAIATAGIATVFVSTAILAPEWVAGGAISAIAAACPAIVMGVLCHEISLASGNHGAGRIAHPTCGIWMVLGAATALAPVLFEAGGAVAPIATLSVCAALLTGFVSVRTWYRNEGYAVTR
ncbi:MAG: hypothetical protein EXS10_06960 [Phycisphaerales bacterium]|nr:hypothetical protein [Phycisphaerales bacterium]